MGIKFATGWGDPRFGNPPSDNNLPAYADGRRCSEREIYVILEKILRTDVRCDDTETDSVRNFLVALSSGEVIVNKGIHGDKLQDRFGMHLTVVVNSGCSIGDTFHLYGGVMANRCWEVDFICRYNPQKWYRANHRISHAIPPAPVIVVAGGGGTISSNSQAAIDTALRGA
jgi:hypothetical protein